MIMDTLKLPVLNADFYLIAPINILNWEVFEQELSNKNIKADKEKDKAGEENKDVLKWVPKTNANSYIIRNHISVFLGEADSNELPMERGFAFKGSLQRSKNKKLSRFNSEVTFRTPKNEPLIDKGKDAETKFTIDDEIVIHVAPNKKCALVYIVVRCENITLDDAVEYNYKLHKTDDNQSPKIICKEENRPSGDSTVDEQERCETLIQIITAMLPDDKSYSFVNKSRFIPATCVTIDASSIQENNQKDSSQKAGVNALTYMGLAESIKYNITTKDKERVSKLFENIWTYSSNEGFAAIQFYIEQPNSRREPFKVRNSAFAQSYLPIYLTALLADTCLKSSLLHLDKVADDVDEQDRLRESRFVWHFEPSIHKHLIQLNKDVYENRNMDVKYKAVAESVEARRIRNESQRIQMEKEEHRRQEKRDRKLEFLLGFIGVGQVIFAIVELIGIKEIWGEQWEYVDCAIRITKIVICIFVALIVYFVIYYINFNVKKLKHTAIKCKKSASKFFKSTESN